VARFRVKVRDRVSIRVSASVQSFTTILPFKIGLSCPCRVLLYDVRVRLPGMLRSLAVSAARRCHAIGSDDDVR